LNHSRLAHGPISGKSNDHLTRWLKTMQWVR
jgi:hypothetical protein